MPASIRLPRLASILVLCLCAPIAAQAGPVIGGNEWRQLTETVGLTWNQVDAICPNDGLSPCSGTILGSLKRDGTFDVIADLTGWTWATQAQVRALFESPEIGVPVPAADVTEPDSTWAPAALALFKPTFVAGVGEFRDPALSLREVKGLVPDTFSVPGDGRDGTPVFVTSLLTPFISDFADGQGPVSDEASTTAGPGPDLQDVALPGVGVWLFRTAPDATVAEPGSLALLALGIAALRGRRRREEGGRKK